MANALLDAAIKAPRPALIAATAPAPGEMLIAHDAAKNINQVLHSMRGF